MREGTILKLLGLLGLAWLMTGCSSGGGGGSPSLLVFGNNLIAITAGLSQYAGAISSIVFRGKEFVNSHDHGRLFQTALQVDGFGECHNPTEAGCLKDVGTNKSTSVLVGYAKTADNVLSTQCQAASWASAPDGTAFCPKGGDPRMTQPTQTVIEKQVTVGELGPNTITWRVRVKCPLAQEKLSVEILTGYLPAEFTNAFRIQPGGLEAVKEWQPLNSPTDGYPDGSTLQAHSKVPIIWSTPGGEYAMGVVRPGAQRCEAWNYTLLKFALDDRVDAKGNSCVKFSVVTHASVSCLGQDSSYVVHLILGTLAEVHTRLSDL